MKKIILIITGATGSGKSALSIKLAEEINGEIINADIGSFYKQTSIGVAKVLEKERKGIPHYCIDFLNFDDKFNVHEFRKLVIEKNQMIFDKNKIPIVVGGSCFYIYSLFFENNFVAETSLKLKEAEEQFLQELEELKIKSKFAAWEELFKVDTERALKLEKNDFYRISNALIKNKLYGIKASDLKYEFNPINKNIFFINCEFEDRSLLYDKINNRVEEMLSDGWLDEVKTIMNCVGGTDFLRSKKIIGYNTLVDFIENKIDFVAAKEIIKKSVRNYAKRQLTFLRKIEKEFSLLQEKKEKNNKDINIEIKKLNCKEFFNEEKKEKNESFESLIKKIKIFQKY